MVSNARLKQGDVVKIHNWHGVILETHFDESGALSVIRVQTARNLFRGYGPEYIDVRLDPEAVSLAALADLEQEIETHRRLLAGALERLLADATPQQEATPLADL
jgi:hypothetical protein